MKPEAKRYSTTVGNQTLTFETGKLAAQAGGAVTFGTSEAIVFAAATMGGVREGIDFFPLQVEYEERLSAGGKIPGSFFRREGRPGTEAILVSRLTDRPLRPLFQHGMRNEVQVVMFSFSSDGIHPLDIFAINAASAAIMISDIPWGGPVGAAHGGPGLAGLRHIGAFGQAQDLHGIGGQADGVGKLHPLARFQPGEGFGGGGPGERTARQAVKPAEAGRGRLAGFEQHGDAAGDLGQRRKIGGQKLDGKRLGHGKFPG